MEPALDLERFAALSAELESGASKDALCAREGISVEALGAAQELWLGKMAEEAARKRFDLTNRYNAAFVAKRRALDGGKRGGRSAARAQAQGDAGKAARPPLAAPPPMAGAAPPPMAGMPSFVGAPPLVAAPPIVAAPMIVAAPPIVAAPIAAPPPIVAAPIIAAPPPIVAAPPAFAATALPPEEYGHATAEGPSPFSRSADPLPFKPGAALLDARPSGPKIVAKAEFTGTLDGEVISPFAKGAALPFGANAAKESPPPAKKRPAPAETVALPVFTDEMIAGGQDPGSATIGPTPSPLRAKKNPLPFTPSADAPPPSTTAPASTARAGGLPFKAGAQPPSANAPPSSTNAPPGSMRAPPSTATPSSADPAARASRFTVEQFASLSAEIAVNPAAVAQVRARYGLDEASHRAEAEAWNRRFSADKELFARYGALFQSYRDWLSKQGR